MLNAIEGGLIRFATLWVADEKPNCIIASGFSGKED